MKKNTMRSPDHRTTGKPSSRRANHRNNLEAEILLHAERVFAEFGYEGTSLATIAESVGLSKQNLLYYFPNKRALYTRVLDGVLDAWLESMALLTEDKRNPADSLRAYIAAKLHFSRERPWGSRVYGMEVISGAKNYRKEIKQRVVPCLRMDIEVFERWIKAGEIAPTNATHLLFTIWAMTQSYADFSTQMALLMDSKKLTRKDFDAAEKLIADMVLAVVCPQSVTGTSKKAVRPVGESQDPMSNLVQGKPHPQHHRRAKVDA